jgi:hypothetical protein
MTISKLNRTKNLPIISVLCISIALVFASCINENSNWHSQPPSLNGGGNPGKIQFELDPIQGVAIDGSGINFSKLIRGRNKDFFDSLLSRIDRMKISDAIHGYDNTDPFIGLRYKIKNAGNFLFVDTGKPANMNKLID